MTSGIYLLGQTEEMDNVFNKYIANQLAQRNVVAFDRSLVPIKDRNKGLLLALSGHSLEEMLSQGILAGFDKAKSPQSRTAPETDVENHWAYTLGLIKVNYKSGESTADRTFSAVYKRISSYADSDAASREFPLRVQEYLLERLGTLSETVSEEIGKLLDQRLSDFVKE